MYLIYHNISTCIQKFKMVYHIICVLVNQKRGVLRLNIRSTPIRPQISCNPSQFQKQRGGKQRFKLFSKTLTFLYSGVLDAGQTRWFRHTQFPEYASGSNTKYRALSEFRNKKWIAPLKADHFYISELWINLDQIRVGEAGGDC